MNLLSFVGGTCAVAVVVNTGVAQNAPALAPTTILPAVFMVGPEVVAGDLNGDGVPDLVQSNPGFAIGTNFVTFRAKLLERDGTQLADAGGSIPAGPPSLAATARVAAGDFDEDGRVDVASMTLSLAIGVGLNTGQSSVVSGFSATALIDDLARVFTVPWPTVLNVPVFDAVDLDGDGHLDLLVAPVLVNHLAQSITSPGMFTYFGRGDGTFEPAVQTAMSSAPVDADWVDWDADGTPETLIVLGQVVPNATSYQSDIRRFRFANRVVQQLGAAQPTGTAMYVTSLAHAFGGPLMGGQHAYFLTGHTLPSLWIMHPGLQVLEVDAQGNVASTSTIGLPLNLAGITTGDLHAAHVADWNGDGHDDLVALHAQKATAAGQLLWMMGPFDTLGSHAGIAVTDLGVHADTRNAPPANGPAFLTTWQPNIGSPRAIAVTDLNHDQMPDLMIGSLMIVTTQATQLVSASICNLSTPSAGPARGGVSTLGPARPTPSGLLPRCGTTGGAPVLGNTDFAVTLTDLPCDALVAPIAGFVEVAFPSHGLQWVFVPEVFGNLQWLHASVAGATRARQDLSVPSDTAFLGVRACLQWLVYDPNANEPLPIYGSNSLRIEFGTGP